MWLCILIESGQYVAQADLIEYNVSVHCLPLTQPFLICDICICNIYIIKLLSSQNCIGLSPLPFLPPTTYGSKIYLNLIFVLLLR